MEILRITGIAIYWISGIVFFSLAFNVMKERKKLRNLYKKILDDLKGLVDNHEKEDLKYDKEKNKYQTKWLSVITNKPKHFVCCGVVLLVDAENFKYYQLAYFNDLNKDGDWKWRQLQNGEGFENIGKLLTHFLVLDDMEV